MGVNQMARSQPHLLQVDGSSSGSPNDHRKFGSHGHLTKPAHNGSDAGGLSQTAVGSNSRKSSTAEMAASGVMYRKDALYSGSVMNLPEYKYIYQLSTIKNLIFGCY